MRSPYDGELIGKVALGHPADVARAIETAAEAMRDPLEAHRRAQILEGVETLMGERYQRLAELIASEAGKPIKLARLEVQRSRATLLAAARVAREMTGEMVPLGGTAEGAGRLGFTLRVPVGVVGAITPFNFPLNLVSHKVAPAIASGCAVVLKPADPELHRSSPARPRGRSQSAPATRSRATNPHSHARG